MPLRYLRSFHGLLVLIGLGTFVVLYLWTNSGPTCLSGHECEFEEQRRRLLESRDWMPYDSQNQDTREAKEEVDNTKSDTFFDILLDDGFKSGANVEKIINNENEKEAIMKFSQDYSVLASSNCSNTLDNPHLVLSCISGTVIGKVPKDEVLGKFQIPKGLKSEKRQKRADSFQVIFENKVWGHGWDHEYKGLGVSGRGATLDWAQELIAVLHIVVNTLKNKLGKSRIQILDVPCGDMSWMGRFLVSRDDIDYTGVDIVPDLISHHKEFYRDFPWKFEFLDIVTDPLVESYDLILNRMMLQHLFLADAARVLDKLSRSSSHYLLTTTFSRHERNEELSFEENPGRFRKLNLEIPPFSLGPPMCLQRDGPWTDKIDGWEHFIGLWKLPLKQVKNCDYPYKLKLKATDKFVYSCSDWAV